MADQKQQLKESIEDLKRNYATQEKVVSLAFDTWNDQLRSLSQEVAAIYEEREDALRENIRLRSESRALMGTIVDLQSILEQQQDKIAKAHTLYLKVTSQYKTEILALRLNSTLN